MTKQTTNLAGALRAELKTLTTPAQVQTFRAELVKVLPAAIRQAAEAARKSGGNNDSINTTGRR